MVSEGTKQRLSIVIDLSKTAFHYAFIPTVLYLGTLQIQDVIMFYFIFYFYRF